jgi:chemotaxis protein MotB
VEHAEESNNQYFISMTDMLLGLLVIFLIIVAYLVLSFSQSLEKARSAEEAEMRAEIAQQAADKAKKDADEARRAAAAANAAKAQAMARAEEAEQRADKLQNIVLSIDKT